MTVNHHQRRETETYWNIPSADSRSFQELWDTLFEGKIERSFWRTWQQQWAYLAAVWKWKLNQSLEIKTAELQRYPKDNELPKTYLIAKPPAYCSLYWCQWLWVFALMAIANQCPKSIPTMFGLSHPKVLNGKKTTNPNCQTSRLHIYWKHIWGGTERSYWHNILFLSPKSPPPHDHLYC